MTHMGRLRLLDRPFPGFSFFKGLRNLSVWYSKVGLKEAQIFLWKVYEKDASSTVVRVSKVSDLNGNLMILNFLEHPRFWYRREQFPGGIASLPLFYSNISHCRCSQTLRKLSYTREELILAADLPLRHRREKVSYFCVISGSHVCWVNAVQNHKKFENRWTSKWSLPVGKLPLPSVVDAISSLYWA